VFASGEEVVPVNGIGKYIGTADLALNPALSHREREQSWRQ
jgi:hypothetical protein